MRRLFVSRWSVGIPINLNQQETRRVVRLLQHVESRNPGFRDAVPCILDAGRSKGTDELRLHVDMDMNDQHRCIHHRPGEQ